MSFGRPGALSDRFKPTPPARGSFPLDHDGECKEFMLSYMSCLKANRSDSGQCRPQAKAYLGCRMDNGLMSREEFENLGLGDVPMPGETASSPRSASATAAAASTAASNSGGGVTGPAGGSSAPPPGTARAQPPPMWTPEERI